jgi:hypothetical protein
MEIESALVANPRVAEAAVVGKHHDIKGESVFAFVVLRGPRPTGDTSALTRELRDWVSEQLGPIAKPDDIRYADNLPKTRSGKIMRRLLRAVANGEEVTQDVSTLENPGILDQLRGGGTGGKAKAKPRKAAKPKPKRARAPERKTAAKRKAAKTRKAPKRKRAKVGKAPRRAAPRRKR